MVLRACENCGASISVRASDVARGWGRYCGKSCKAQHQAKRWEQPKKAQTASKHTNVNSLYEDSLDRRHPLLEIGPGRSYENRWKGFEEWDAIVAEEDRANMK